MIVDTPPAGILSDAAMLASCVDGGVFVVRQDFADVRILTEGNKGTFRSRDGVCRVHFKSDRTQIAVDNGNGFLYNEKYGIR